MASNIECQDRRIVLLDSNHHLILNEENQQLILQLRSIVNTIESFTDIKKCMNYLDQNRAKQNFLIISIEFLSKMTLFKEHCTSIYIFCNDKSNIHQTDNKVFTSIDHLCNELRKQVRQLDDDSVSVNVISKSSVENLNELKPSFMYFQLLKENLLKIKYDREKNIAILAERCRPKDTTRRNELEIISEFQKTYGKIEKQSAIWWYTRDCFLYHELNRALRDMNIEMLFKLGFFIKDLHEQLKELHSNLNLSEIPPICYRGQGLFNNDFKELKLGNLFTFNNFLSTSVKKHVAEDFASYSSNDDNKTAVVFIIEIDTSIRSVPFSPIEHLTAIKKEEEILFSIATVFRIGKIEQNLKTKFWEVNLSLTNDRDPLLKRLMNHIRISLGNGNEWRQIGQLMIKMGQFDKAMDVYQMLLGEVDSNDRAENGFLHNQLGYLYKQQNKLDQAFSHYQQALEIYRTYTSDTDPQLSSIYSNIGGILKKLGDASGALKYYELVLKIDLAATKSNPLEIAIDHNNIGSVLDDLGKYPEALKSYEEALRIKLSHLPPNHPSLASTFSNMGLIHRKLGNFEKALQFYEDTLEVQKKSLLPDHPSFIITYGKLATLMEDLHNYKQAIDYAEKALKLAEKINPPEHPEIEKRRKYLVELRAKT